MTSNVQRVDLNPVEEARAFARMKDQGRNAKQIAHELGLSQKLVTERLALLELPEEILAAIGETKLAPGHVPTLQKLAKVAPNLALVAARAAITAKQSAQGFANAPLGYACTDTSLDVWITQGAIADVADLSEKACALVTELNGLVSYEVNSITLGVDVIEEGEKVGVVFRGATEAYKDPNVAITSREWLVDAIERELAKHVKTQKAHAKERSERDAAHAGSTAPDATKPEGEVQTEEQVKEAKRAARELELRQRDASHAYNQRLGQKLMELPELEFDKNTALFLADLVFAQDERLGGAGLAYVLPLFVSEETRKDGSTKRTFDIGGAREYAAEFVGSGQTAEQVLTRLAIVLGAALHADNRVESVSARQSTLVTGRFPAQVKRLLKPLNWRAKKPDVTEEG